MIWLTWIEGSTGLRYFWARTPVPFVLAPRFIGGSFHPGVTVGGNGDEYDIKTTMGLTN